MSSISTTSRAAVTRAIRARMDGVVVGQGDPAWDEARRAYNLAVDQRPAAVGFPLDERDVAAAIAAARDHGLRVAPQRTGHNAGPLGSQEDLLLLRTDAMQGVEIDACARRARVRAGAKWEDVVPRASELGLAALHGSTPDVSVAGYALGGGMGWYARKLGLAANSVTAIELVTADGELRRVDHDTEPELFWALRGGGGSFGVVTSLELELYPIESVYAGALFFPWERTAEVLHAWHSWVVTVPDEVTSVGRVLQFPPLDFIPEVFRGRSFALIEAVYLGSAAEGSDLVRPLRELGPELDTFATVSPVGIAELHMDPPDPLPYAGGAHRLLGELPPAAVDDLAAVIGAGSGSPLITMEVRHTGGALARSEAHHGALSTLPGSFATYGAGLVTDAATLAANEAQLARVMAALAPYDAGRYLNFTDEATETSAFFPADTYRRLSAVKAAYDPEGVFRANHPIPAAA